jgi:Calx-beta domain
MLRALAASAMAQLEKFTMTLLMIAVSALAFFLNAEAIAATYTTSFTSTEDPISENGRWIGGKTVGLAWSDFQSVPGLAFGKQAGTSPGVYDDAIALLTGTWGPNQTVQATVKTVNQNDSFVEELEIRLRSTVTPNSSTGYECNFSARRSANAYVQIVRWNGAFGDFTPLDGRGGSSYALHNGDTITCTINGSTITAYINGVQKLQVVDSTFTGGNPGIGAFLQNATGVNGDYGFTSFTASDGLVAPPPPGTGTGTISLSASSYSVNEAAGSVVISAVRTGGSNGAVSVGYATSDGTAVAGSDYIASIGNLSWGDGDASRKTFSVPIVNDAIAEANETFVVRLGTPTGGATVGSPSSATVTILKKQRGRPYPPHR